MKWLLIHELIGVGGLLLNHDGDRFCNELGDRAYVFRMMNGTAYGMRNNDRD